MYRLKQLRIEKKVTQSDVAKFLNVTRQGYANYETGKTSPTPTILVKLADYFECTVDYLVGRESERGSVIINADLKESEEELLSIYRSQTEQNKKYLLTFARGLADKF